MLSLVPNLSGHSLSAHFTLVKHWHCWSTTGLGQMLWHSLNANSLLGGCQGWHWLTAPKADNCFQAALRSRITEIHSFNVTKVLLTVNKLLFYVPELIIPCVIVSWRVSQDVSQDLSLWTVTLKACSLWCWIELHKITTLSKVPKRDSNHIGIPIKCCESFAKFIACVVKASVMICKDESHHFIRHAWILSVSCHETVIFIVLQMCTFTATVYTHKHRNTADHSLISPLTVRCIHTVALCPVVAVSSDRFSVKSYSDALWWLFLVVRETTQHANLWLVDYELGCHLPTSPPCLYVWVRPTAWHRILPEITAHKLTFVFKTWKKKNILPMTELPCYHSIV